MKPLRARFVINRQFKAVRKNPASAVVIVLVYIPRVINVYNTRVINGYNTRDIK